MADLLRHFRTLKTELRGIDDAALKKIFCDGRSYNAWLDKPVDEATLRNLWELVRLGPTAVNGMPARLVFVISEEGKLRIRSSLNPGNIDKVMNAPVTAIVGYDVNFWEKLPELFPHKDVHKFFRENPASAEETAFRNGSLQGAWMMLAARALGLDCGPMSGFDAAALDAEFFKGTSIRTNFLCNLGYGDGASLLPRLPRLDFDDACAFA